MRYPSIIITYIFVLFGSLFSANSALAYYEPGIKDGYSVFWTTGIGTWPNWLPSSTPEGGCQEYADALGSFGGHVVDNVVPQGDVISTCTIRKVADGGISFVDVKKYCYIGGAWQQGDCPQADDNLAMCVATGNPIVVSDGVKIQRASDWRSPKDNRFSFGRNYRGDLIMGRSPVAESFGMAWGSRWDVQLTVQEAGELMAHRADATRFLFSGSGQMVPYRSGHRFELLSSDLNEGGRRRLTDGTGRQEFFLNGGPATNKLDEVRWADGYSINITRDVSDRIDQVTDSRGQVAQYYWDDTLNANYTVPVVTKIEIDTDYDGITFLPEVALDYSYEVVSIFGSELILKDVSRTDLALASSQDIWAYEYSSNINLGSPIKLTGIGDGRINDIGNPYMFANFTYQPVTTAHYRNTSRAIQTERFGGTDAAGLTFNADGSVTLTNALGKETVMSFATIEGRKRPVTVAGVATTSCLGTAQTIGYTPGVGEPSGYVYERIERNGSRTTFTRDVRGLVFTKTEDTDGLFPRVTSFTWEPNLRLPLTRTTSQMQETYTYSATGSLLTSSQTDVLAGSPDYGKVRTWTFGYTTQASGLEVLSSVDGPGLALNSVNDITTYAYDANGVLQTTTDSVGLVTDIVSTNAAGQPTLALLPDDAEWAFNYDIEGQLISSTFDPDGDALTTSYIYDTIGQVTSITNTLGKTWTYTYDEAKRLTDVTDPLSHVMSFTHDLMGNVTNAEYSDGINPASFAQNVEFDELGRLLKTIGGEGQIWNFSHDVEDNLDSITDPQLNAVNHIFGPLNRITQSVDRANGTTQMGYNDSDQLTTYTDPRSLNTGFTYNGFGEVIQEVSSDRGTITTAYNDRGLVSSMTDARGVTSTYEYDDAGRLIAKNFPTTPTEDQTFIYDLTNGTNTNSIGKLTLIYDESGFMRIKRRDNGTVDRERRNIDGQDYYTNYNYDLEGRLIWMEFPSLRRLYFTYDGAGNLTKIRTRMQITDSGTGSYPPFEIIVKSAKYQPHGPLRRLIYGDGYDHIVDFDDSYRVTRIWDKDGASVLRDININWSSRDNISSIVDNNDGAATEFYDYTPREQLTKAIGAWDEIDYTYDPIGNRTSRVATVGASVSTDAYNYPSTSNRLQSIAEAGGFNRAFTYDAAGNVTYDNRSGGGYGYTYNAAGRMDSFSINGVVQAEYTYNALGQQVVRTLTQTSQEIHSVYDLDGNRIAEYDAGTLLREYVWFNGTAIAVIEGGVTYYVRTDHIGRPEFATDGTGAKVWEATYLPFGGVHTSTGANIDLRFPGQWFQSESGLHQNWMRDYDPTTGRYIQADPLGLIDGASVYGYVRQNPGRYSDPTGTFTLDDAYQSLLDQDVFNNHGQVYSDEQLFNEWLSLEKDNTEWVKDLTPCPPSINMCESSDDWGSIGPANPEHPGGIFEVRSKPTSGGHANQCVYDADGNLMTGIPAAGTADFRAMSGLGYQHLQHDLMPWNLAKSLNRRKDYYSVRPVVAE